MSDWNAIIARHLKQHDLGAWSIIPPSHYEQIARQCGPAELTEVRARLRSLDREMSELPEWDGEAQDEIWRARHLFEAVLRFHRER
jgi:hypothetical protein